MTAEKPSFARAALESTAVYSVGMIATRMASFVMLRVYTKFLTPADYGVLELSDLSFYLVGALVGMGLASDALFYFLARCKSRGERAGLVYSLLAGGFLLSLIMSAALFVFARNVSVLVFNTEAYARVVRIASASFALSTPLELALSYVRACNRARHFLYFSLARMFGQIAMNVIFMALAGMGLYSILTSTAIATALLLVAALVYVIRELGAPAGLDFRVIKRVAAYSAPLGIGGAGMLLIHYGDRFFLRTHCSLAVIGIYALGYKYGMFLSTLNDPLKLFWRSQVHVVLKEGSEEGERVFVRMFTFCGVFSMLAWYILSSLSQPLVMISAHSPFWGAATYIPWVATAYLWRALTFQVETGLLAGNKTRWVMISNWSGSAVCLAGYIWAIPRYGVWGAILATNAAFLTMFVITMTAAQHFHPRRLEAGKLVAAALTLAVCYALQSIAPVPAEPWKRIAVQAAFSLLGPGALYLLPALRQEREQTRTLLGQIAARFA